MATEGLRGSNAGVSNGEWSLGRDLYENAVGHSPDAALAEWRRWAASAAQRKKTRRGSGAAPEG
jgi:hypothetical protein